MPVHAIDYATGPRRRKMPFTVLHMTIWLTLMSLSFLFLGCFVAPRYESIFSDFRLDLPPITRLVFIAAQWCRNDFGWLFLLMLPTAPKAFDLLNGNHWARDGVPRRARILFVLFILVWVFALCLFGVATFSPMTTLQNGVSSPKLASH